MSKSIRKISIVVVAILVAVYIFYQLVYINVKQSSITTELAMSYTVTDTIDTTGTIIRDEQVIQNTEGGVVSYQVTDGEKVAKDGVIAQVCKDEETVNAKMRIDYINEATENLNKIIENDKTMRENVTSLNKLIDDSFIELMDTIANKELVEMRDVQNELLMYFNRKQLSVGDMAQLEAELASLEAEKAQLEAQYGDSSTDKNITATESGFFVSEVDGYENVLKVDSPSEISVEMLENSKPEPVPENIIGKIQNNEKYYIGTVLTKEQALKLRKGSTVYLQIPLIDLIEIPVTVEEINHSEDVGKSAVIFGCTYQNKELALSRIIDIKIIIKEYTGLKITTPAIRTIEGVQGIYVLINNRIEFKEIDPQDIIYTSTGYILYDKASPPTSDGSQGVDASKLEDQSTDEVLLYDQIIVDGKNVYEGKIIAQ